jgi:hypothetical protein
VKKKTSFSDVFEFMRFEVLIVSKMEAVCSSLPTSPYNGTIQKTNIDIFVPARTSNLGPLTYCNKFAGSISQWKFVTLKVQYTTVKHSPQLF